MSTGRSECAECTRIIERHDEQHPPNLGCGCLDALDELHEDHMTSGYPKHMEQRYEAWPNRLSCPLNPQHILLKSGYGGGGVRYKCDWCGLEVRFPMAQIEKRKIRNELP